MKYSHSDNEETFHGQFDSEKEAVEDAFNEYEDAEVIYVGECHTRTIGAYLNLSDIQNLLDSMSERANEECGEVTDGWLDHSFQYRQGESNADRTERVKAWKKSEAERLAFLLDGFKIVLEAWATEEGCQPGFLKIENVRCFDRIDYS